MRLEGSHVGVGLAGGALAWLFAQDASAADAGVLVRAAARLASSKELALAKDAVFYLTFARALLAALRAGPRGLARTLADAAFRSAAALPGAADAIDAALGAQLAPLEVICRVLSRRRRCLQHVLRSAVCCAARHRRGTVLSSLRRGIAAPRRATTSNDDDTPPLLLAALRANPHNVVPP